MDIKVTDTLYKLRAGAPMPIGHNDFITQTFMAEESTVDNYLYTTSLKSSSSFRGRGGDYVSANFNRLLNTLEESFTGSVVHSPDYVEER